mgnify:CR=1 FL=1
MEEHPEHVLEVFLQLWSLERAKVACCAAGWAGPSFPGKPRTVEKHGIAHSLTAREQSRRQWGDAQTDEQVLGRATGHWVSSEISATATRPARRHRLNTRAAGDQRRPDPSRAAVRLRVAASRAAGLALRPRSTQRQPPRVAIRRAARVRREQPATHSEPRATGTPVVDFRGA